jgi:hypothetical protein
VTTCAEVGVILTATPSTTVAVAVADFVGSATEVAFSCTSAGLGTTAGAVYRPAVVIVPHAVPLHPAPDNCQVTAVLVVPVTVAVY